MRTKFCTVLTILAVISVGFFAAGLMRAADVAPDAKIDPQTYKSIVSKGMSYLIEKGQAEDGSYSAKASPAVTAICAASLLANGKSPDDPAVAKSLKYLEGFVQPDGGIYKPNSNIQNYETSISLMCFLAANKDGRYKKIIADANNYIKNIQWGADGKVAESDLKFGGAGYGRTGSRPDLSNTAFLVEALHEVNDESNSEAIERCSCSYRDAKTCRANTTRPNLRRRIPTAAFFTRLRMTARARPAEKPKTAGCGATAR